MMLEMKTSPQGVEHCTVDGLCIQCQIFHASWPVVSASSRP